MSTPIDWTKPIERIGGGTARVLDKLRNSPRYAVAIQPDPRDGEYSLNVGDDGSGVIRNVPEPPRDLVQELLDAVMLYTRYPGQVDLHRIFTAADALRKQREQEKGK